MIGPLIIIGITVLGIVIGSIIGVIRKPSEWTMMNMISFAAGTMLAISFMELIPEGIRLSSVIICALGILAGTIVMLALKKFIPHIHPRHYKKKHQKEFEIAAFYIFIGIFLHNFPEGMAVGIGGLSDFKISLVIAIAIAIHNIPEGICTSAPYFLVTKKRLESVLISFSTIIPTVLGFLLAYFLFPSISLAVMGFLISLTAGLMIYISCDELIPLSCDERTNHSAIFSLILGILTVVLLGLI
jgi:ZIP family zinc transporter